MAFQGGGGRLVLSLSLATAASGDVGAIALAGSSWETQGVFSSFSPFHSVSRARMNTTSRWANAAGPAGHEEQATQYLQSLVLGKAGREGERVHFCFFPPPAHQEQFRLFGGIMAVAALSPPAAAVGDRAGTCRKLAGRAELWGKGRKKDQCSGLRWVKDYRKAVPSPSNPPAALPLPSPHPSLGTWQQGKESSTRDPTPVSCGA